MGRGSGKFGKQLRKVLSWAREALRLIPPGIVPTRREKNLRLCETLSLGEKRFLAVVQVERQQFLIGGSGSSISLLTQLPSAPATAGAQPGTHKGADPQ